MNTEPLVALDPAWPRISLSEAEARLTAPGERFEYTSGVPLSTASGFMAGRYQMVSETGERFEIEVPTFSLDSPDNKRVLN